MDADGRRVEDDPAVDHYRLIVEAFADAVSEQDAGPAAARPMSLATTCARSTLSRARPARGREVRILSAGSVERPTRRRIKTMFCSRYVMKENEPKVNFAGQDAVTGSSLLRICSRRLRIAGVTLRNRAGFQPHFTALGTSTGMPTDDLAAYHEERARGGVGLIVTESLAIYPDRQNVGALSRLPGTPRSFPASARSLPASTRTARGFSRSSPRRPHLARASAAHHVGADADAGTFEPLQHQGARRRRHPRASSTVSASARATRSQPGFDGIEIKIAHDGLLRSFASPFFNHRTDAYGGSFENRMRLSFEVYGSDQQRAIGAQAARRAHLPRRVHRLRLRPRLRPADGPRVGGDRPRRLFQFRRRHRSRPIGWNSRRRLRAGSRSSGSTARRRRRRSSPSSRSAASRRYAAPRRRPKPATPI